MSTSTTTLPTTDLTISRIAVGGNIFGHFTDERETAAILRAAADNGVNFIDTADTYSEGRSEELIGKCLPEISADWVVATKIGVPSHASVSGLGRAPIIRRRCEASLRRLGRETIELLQLHHFDPETPLAETLGVLSDLRHEGKILSFGVSNFTRIDLAALAKTRDAVPLVPCATLQIPLNVFWSEWYDSVRTACREQGIAILPYNTLARGVLSGKYRDARSLPPGSRARLSESIRAGLTGKVIDRLRQAEVLCETQGITLGQAALLWALDQPGVASSPVGFRNPDQLAKMAAATRLSIPPAFLLQLHTILRKNLAAEDRRNLIYQPDRQL